MGNIIERIYKSSSKKPYLALNIIILTIYLIFVTIFISVIFNYKVPDLKTATGTISSFKHHEKSNPNLIDYFANDAASYLDVEFTDGSSFRAIGIRYNNIDVELFSDIAVGAKITLVYEDKGFGGGIDLIYGIEYNGTTYMSTDDVLKDFEIERKSMVNVFLIIIAAITVAAGGAFTANYLAFKRKAKEKISE